MRTETPTGITIWLSTVAQAWLYHNYFEKTIVNSKNVCKLYKSVNSRLEIAAKLPALPSENGELAYKDVDKSEVLAQEFRKAYSDHVQMDVDDSGKFPRMRTGVWFYRDEIIQLISSWSSSYSVTHDSTLLDFI